MTIRSAAYSDSSNTVCTAVIDGITWSGVNPGLPGFYNAQLAEWIAAGNVPSPYAAPAAPTPTCQLWQLQAVMTPSQWQAAQTAVANLNSASVLAFFSHPGNSIPANSTTLIALAAAIGLTQEQIAALVAEASQVSIP